MTLGIKKLTLRTNWFKSDCHKQVLISKNIILNHKTMYFYGFYTTYRRFYIFICF